MVIITSMTKKLILWSIFRLLFVFLVPVQFLIFSEAGNISYVISSQSYYLQTVGEHSTFVLFSWILARYPVSLILGLLALSFSFRLHQRRESSFPIFSALAVSITLAIIPAYLFVQYFSASRLVWFGIMHSSPVSIGYCIISLLLFVILPSVSWHSSEIEKQKLGIQEENGIHRVRRKRLILTPKIANYLVFIGAFLLPGLIIWQTDVYSLPPNSIISFTGFLLQIFYSFYTEPPSQRIGWDLQQVFSMRNFALPIVCCLVGFLFALAIMRYTLGKGSKQTAVIMGFIAQIPFVAYSILSFNDEQFVLILPFPVFLILGLFVLHSVYVIEPSSKDDDLEIPIPILVRLQSHLFRRDRTVSKKSSEDGDNQEDEVK